MRAEIEDLKLQKLQSSSSPKMSPQRHRTQVGTYDSPQRRTILDSETKTEDSIQLRTNQANETAAHLALVKEQLAQSQSQMELLKS